MIITEKGIKIGFLAYCSSDEGCLEENYRDRVSTGPAIYDKALAIREAKRLRKVKNLKRIRQCLFSFFSFYCNNFSFIASTRRCQTSIRRVFLFFPNNMPPIFLFRRKLVRRHEKHVRHDGEFRIFNFLHFTISSPNWIKTVLPYQNLQSKITFSYIKFFFWPHLLTLSTKLIKNKNLKKSMRNKNENGNIKILLFHAF